jgi:hypothetical protein
MQRARAILPRNKYAAEVRERERFYQQQGIGAVPSVIIDDRHLIRGGQLPCLWLQLGHRLYVHGQVRCQQAAYRRRQLMAGSRY